MNDEIEVDVTPIGSPIGVLIQSLTVNATKNKNPLAVTIPGWVHDLIVTRLRNRGVVFTVKNDYGAPSEEEGYNDEGRWTVRTERFGEPCSVIIFHPF